MTFNARVAYGERVNRNAKQRSLVDGMVSYVAGHGAVEHEAGIVFYAEDDLESVEEKLSKRCNYELSRKPIHWKTITKESFDLYNDKQMDGMFYGLPFPWNADMLEDMGPKWLTKAFRKSGAIDKTNKVIQLSVEKSAKIETGNNAGRCFFHVKYLKPNKNLHTQLFAKLPFPYSGDVATDRVSSSVMKQGMDYGEINAYRLFEASFPFTVPRYYYGDINNDSTNYILILSRIPFASGVSGGKKRTPLPYQIEGPYSKCRDYELLGDPFDYYMLIMRKMGMINGVSKAGLIGGHELCEKTFGNMDTARKSVEPRLSSEATGADPKALLPKLDFAIKFISDIAKIIFPPYCRKQSFQSQFYDVCMTMSAYDAELTYWKFSDIDYFALCHQNLNVDNAYFWKDEKGTLDCGVLDFGGFGNNCIAHAVWWVLMAAPFEVVKRLPQLMEVLANTYHEFGGPVVDPKKLEQIVLMTGLSNAVFMQNTLSNCMRMCPASSWAEITNPRDERIWGYIKGKGTLRTTMQALMNQVRIIGEMDGLKEVERWIDRVYVQQFRSAKKSEKAIWGPGGRGTTQQGEADSIQDGNSADAAGTFDFDTL